MNILHVINIYFSLTYFGEQFRHFVDKGYNEHVICSPSEFFPEYAKKQKIKYREVPINRKISIKDDLIAIKEVYKYIKANDIDVVEGHTPKGALVGMIAAWLARVPKRLYFRHGLVYETSKGLKRFILVTCDRVTSFCATQVVCVSPSVLEISIKDKLAPVKKQFILGKGTCGGVDTKYHFNPANVNQADVDQLRAKYGISKDDFVIGFTGRLVKDKGIIELVRAFNMLKDRKHLKLLLVGMFEERDALPEDVKESILHAKDVVYTGFINGGMEKFYSLMNVYTLPSYREGFPTGVLEAQSMGLPILTTTATGCRDSIVDGKTGLFITHDPEDIAQKIDMIRNDYAIDGNNGRKWVKENFDNEIIWNEIEKLY